MPCACNPIERTLEVGDEFLDVGCDVGAGARHAGNADEVHKALGGRGDRRHAFLGGRWCDEKDELQPGPLARSPSVRKPMPNKGRARVRVREAEWISRQRNTNARNARTGCSLEKRT